MKLVLFLRDGGAKSPCKWCSLSGIYNIIAGVAESVELPEKQQKLNISVGIAPYNGQEKNYSELFKKADTALYKAKADPKNRFCIYS